MRYSTFGRRTSGKVAAAAAAIAVAALLAGLAQAQERRQRTQPMLRPWSDAPTALVRQLVFSQGKDGTLWLYAAGDEKLVRRWGVLEQAGQLSLKMDEQPLPWPIYRDVRGLIKALDVHTTEAGDQRVAIGGVGQQKSSQVNVLMASRPDLAEVLIERRPEYEQRGNSVESLDLAPSGKLLAVGYAAGAEVLLWDVGSPRGNAPRKALAQLKTGFSEVAQLAFSPSGNRLAVAGTGGGKRRVQVWDVAKRTRLSESDLKARAQDLAWANDDTWLVATSVQELNQQGKWVIPADSGLEQGTVGNAATLIVLGGRFVTRLEAVPGTNNFVLGMVEAADLESQRGSVFQWTPGGQPQPLQAGKFDDLVTALAVSPDGRFAAATGGAKTGAGQVPVYQVRVWNVASGELESQVPSVEAALAVGGPIGNVAILPGEVNPASGLRRPDSVAFSFGQFIKNRPHIPLTQKLRLLIRKGITCSPLAAADRAVRTPEDRIFFDQQGGGFFLAKADANGGAADAWLLPSTTASNFPYCYAINTKGNLLAIGYVTGILVCDLAKIKQQQGEKAILRSFYGHSAPVTCVGFSDDDEWMVSGSMDGTICGWSLKNMKPGGELGVEFFVANQTRFLTVKNDPPVNSPGWEAGFAAGQVISSVDLSGQNVPAQKWVETLGRPIPGKPLIVGIQKLTEKLQTLVSHDPIWTLYPYQDGQWLLWTPQGHFDCSAAGEVRAKWHVNLSGAASVVPGAEVGALLFDTATFTKKYRVKPDDDSIAKAIKARFPGEPPAGDLTLPLTLSGLALEPDGQPGRHRVTVLAQLPSSAFGLKNVQVLVNGRLLDAEYKPPVSGTIAISTTLESSLLRGDYRNELVVVTEITGGEQISISGLVPLGLDGQAPAVRKLHYLGIGVTALAEAAKANLKELKQTANDAKALAEAFTNLPAHPDNPLEIGSVTTLTADQPGREPTEKNIRREIEALGQAAGPNDLAIVLIATHGVTSGDKDFRLIAQDSAFDKGLTAIQVSELLSKLSCRSLLLLDTCHSGNVGLTSQLGGWPGLEVGPMILAASAGNQTSKESIKVGHGLFTAAILEALTGPRQVFFGKPETKQPPRPRWDENGDGKLSIVELCRYAERRTPEMIREVGDSDQDPTTLPSATFTDADEFTLMSAIEQTDGKQQ